MVVIYDLKCKLSIKQPKTYFPISWLRDKSAQTMSYCPGTGKKRTNCPWIYPWIHPWMYPWVYPWIYPWVYPWIYPWIHPWIHPWIYPWMYPWVSPWVVSSLSPSAGTVYSQYLECQRYKEIQVQYTNQVQLRCRCRGSPVHYVHIQPYDLCDHFILARE